MGNNKTNIAGSKIQEQGSVKMKSSMNNGFDLMALYGRIRAVRIRTANAGYTTLITKWEQE